MNASHDPSKTSPPKTGSSKKAHRSERAGRARFPFVALPLALLVVGCHDEPQPSATSTTGAGPMGSNDPHAAIKNNVVLPPIVQKTSLAERCVYDTLSFRNARTGYMRSLGTTEPGPGKLPDFGQDRLGDGPTPAGSGSATPAAGSAAPKTPPAAPSAKAPPAKATASASAGPAASAAPSASAGPADRPQPTGGKVIPDRRLTGIRYQQYTQPCEQLLNVKEPGGGELDKAVAEWAPFATSLAKTLTDAGMYYQQESYKKDDFAQGKELHKKLLEAFDKLDAFQTRLLAALKEFEEKNPLDQTAWTEGQKLSHAFNRAAIAYYLDVNALKPDWKTAKDDLTKVDAALQAMTDHRKANANDPFVQRCIGGAEMFVQQAHSAFDESEDKGKERDYLLPAQGIALTNFLERLFVNDNQATIHAAGGGGPVNFGDKVRPRVPNGRPGGMLPRMRPAPKQKQE